MANKSDIYVNLNDNIVNNTQKISDQTINSKKKFIYKIKEFNYLNSNRKLNKIFYETKNLYYF